MFHLEMKNTRSSEKVKMKIDKYKHDAIQKWKNFWQYMCTCASFWKLQSKLYRDKEMNDNKFMAMQCIKK